MQNTSLYGRLREPDVRYSKYAHADCILTFPTLIEVIRTCIGANYCVEQNYKQSGTATVSTEQPYSQITAGQVSNQIDIWDLSILVMSLKKRNYNGNFHNRKTPN